MQRFIQFFVQPRIISLIGIIAISLLVWFIGADISYRDHQPLKTEFARLLTILILVTLWGINNLFRQYQSRRSNEKLLDAIAKPQQPLDQRPDPNAEKIDELQNQFEQAINQLRGSTYKNRFGTQFLYELPWYAIIGPPGSGKSKLIENSGLQFLTEHKKIRGVGGTRNCDWWFTDDAVLLDTAGRFISQDSHAQHDANEWHGFLDLLRKYRPRRPLNGIIVGVGIDEILGRTPAARESTATAIRQRIQELSSHLSVRLPIYIVFTKFDLISGFNEYFDDLNDEARRQVWGATFDPHKHQGETQWLSTFNHEYDTLVNRLQERGLIRLLDESNVARRASIYHFAEQVARLKPSLSEFLDTAFAKSHREQTPWVRGFYLTSSVQEGSPFDQLTQKYAHLIPATDFSPQKIFERTRTFFINRLFRSIIFQETELATSNVRYERHRTWLQRGAFATAATAIFGIIVLWSAAATDHSQTLTNLDANTKNHQTNIQQTGHQPDVPQILDFLHEAKTLTTTFDNPNHWWANHWWTFGLGALQRVAINTQSEQVYINQLRRFLLPFFIDRLEQQLRSAAQDPEETLRLLSLYDMFGYPQRMSPKRLLPWVEKESIPNHDSNANSQATLVSFTRQLLENEFPPQRLNASLRESAKSVVCRIPLHKQIYASLKVRAEEMHLSSINFNKLDRSVMQVFSNDHRLIDGFYTHAGYQEVVKKLGKDVTKNTIEKNKLVCNEENQQAKATNPRKLLADVERLYFNDYIAQWRRFLKTIKLVEIKNMNQNLTVLDILSNFDSPLVELLTLVDDETSLGGSALSNKFKKKKFVSRMLDTLPINPPTAVDIEFVSYQAVIAVDEQDKQAITTFLADLKELRDFIAEIAETSAVNEAAFHAAKARMENSKDVIRRLRSSSKRLPQPFKAIVSDVATQSWGIVLASARKYINSEWRATAYQQCRTNFENRYPIQHNSRDMVNLGDFGEFFGEDGTLEAFTNTYLATFIDLTRLHPVSRDDRRLGISQAFLSTLKQARQIRRHYFANGGRTPLIKFTLEPVKMLRDVEEIRIDINGQLLSWDHGPITVTEVEWPGPGESGTVNIAFKRFELPTRHLNESELWAWFKIFDQSNPVYFRRKKDVVLLKFSPPDNQFLSATYRLKAASVDNPFSTRTIKNFRCPKAL